MPLKRILIYGAIACAAIIAISQLPRQTNDAVVGTRKASDRDRSTPAYEPPPRDTSRDCMRAGEICELRGRLMDSLEWTPTCTSLAAHEELQKAIQADDKDGIAEMLQRGSLLDTKPGDRIRILDVSVWNGRIEGRMTGGKHAGRKVWVSRRFIARPAAGL